MQTRNSTTAVVRGARGRQKKSDEPHRAWIACAEYQTHPRHPSPARHPAFVFLDFCLVRFWALLGKGSSKTPFKYFCTTSMSKAFPKPKQIDNVLMSVFPRFFFYRVFGCFSVRGVQKHDKKISPKRKLTLVLFRPLTHPPTTGVPEFFWRPRRAYARL
jgi:hypothetical protein